MIRDPAEVLSSVFGFAGFRGVQGQVIADVVAGRDVALVMPTGAGKSLCYQIPAMCRPGCGIVVSPLIALMADQVRALGLAGVRAAALNSQSGDSAETASASPQTTAPAAAPPSSSCPATCPTCREPRPNI